MREGSWLLVLDETKQRAELHDVVADRAQSVNLAAKQPERVQSMTTAIEKWFATLPKGIDPALQSKVAAKPAAKATRPAPPTPTPETRLRAFKKWDSNQDGHLTLDEYRTGLTQKTHAETRFQNFDLNSDGKLTQDEFARPSAK
jgi:hypothetical protein